MCKLKDSVYHSWESQSIITNIFCPVFLWSQAQQPACEIMFLQKMNNFKIEWMTTPAAYLGMRFFGGMCVSRCHVYTMMEITFYLWEY